MAVTWKEPPEGRPPGSRPPGRAALQAEAGLLRKRPGVPAIVDRFLPAEKQSAYNLVNAIRTGRLVAFRPAGAFHAEAHTEKNDRGNIMVNVYAKYLGEPGG